MENGDRVFLTRAWVEMKIGWELQVIGEKRTDPSYASLYLNSVPFLNTPFFLFTAFNYFLPINSHIFYKPVLFVYWPWELFLLLKCFEDNNLKPYLKCHLELVSIILKFIHVPNPCNKFNTSLHCLLLFLFDNYVSLDYKFSRP